MKIMIVEDHAEMRRMLCSVVNGAAQGPVHIVECVDGEEAVRRYGTERPDLLLMDVQLGRMNGFAAAEAIMHLDHEAAVIFVTSHNTSAYRTKAKLMRARGFVSKDNLSELETLLHSKH